MTAARRDVERLFHRLGRHLVAGVDEVGMGPLAGPVVAAAVVLPRAGRLPRVADSKVLTPRSRESLARQIRRVAIGVGIGIVEAADVDRLRIDHAGREAMRRALDGLGSLRPDAVVVDGRDIAGLEMMQVSFPGADAFVACVAAASIVAKVERDAIMRALDAQYPCYGFGRHMGYGTPAHLGALAAHGPSPVHRRSFAPVARADAGGACGERPAGQQLP